MNRINIITLGVKDVQKSFEFQQKLGFETPNKEEVPAIVFFNNGGSKLALYPFEQLAQDTGEKFSMIERQGFSGFTMAYNAKTKGEVDEILSLAEKSGGMIVKKAENTFWGGYGGYFKDLDGYYWEVAYADFWQFDENEMLVITE